MTAITQEAIDDESIINGTCCGPTTCTAGQLDEYGTEVSCKDLQGYTYYLADRKILAFDEATNETVDITADVSRHPTLALPFAHTAVLLHLWFAKHVDTLR
jgi:hypothetical protein